MLSKPQLYRLFW